MLNVRCRGHFLTHFPAYLMNFRSTSQCDHPWCSGCSICGLEIQNFVEYFVTNLRSLCAHAGLSHQSGEKYAEFQIRFCAKWIDIIIHIFLCLLKLNISNTYNEQVEHLSAKWVNVGSLQKKNTFFARLWDLWKGSGHPRPDDIKYGNLAETGQFSTKHLQRANPLTQPNVNGITSYE